MSFQEAKIIERVGDPSHYQRGQQDFVKRQLGRWLPRLPIKFKKQNALPFCTELLCLLNRFLQHDQQQLSPSLIPVAR